MRLPQPFIDVLSRFCLAALLIVSPALSAGDDTEKPQATREELKILQQGIKKLTSLLDEYRGKRSSARKSLRKTEVNIGDMQKRIRRIKRQLNEQQQSLKTLQTRRTELERKKLKQQEHISQQIVESYRLGKEKKLKVALNQQDPQTLSRVMTYYDYFNRARSEQVAEYRTTLLELNEIEPAIVQKTQALEDSKGQLTEQHAALKVEHQQRENVLRRLELTIKDKGADLERLNKDREELEALLEAVEETIANLKIPNDYRPFAARKGKMVWPTSGALKYSYGSRQGPGKVRQQGVTITTSTGATVNAIHHGRVVFADWFRGKGLLIIIDHGDGFMSLYAHNQSLLSETGDWVRAGEEIATVGNSGGQRDSGLYFEIRNQGKPTNPKHWCQARETRHKSG